MHRKALTAAAACLLVIGAARDAAAQVGQPWTDRAYIGLGVGFETVSGELGGARTIRQYGEDGTLEVTQSVDSGALFDFTAGARVWRNVTVGIGYHRETTTGEGTLTASVPSPVVFNAPRPATAAVGDLKRSEGAFHLLFGYMIPINPKMRVHISAGPAFFSVSQDVVSEATITEVGSPYTSVNVTPVVTEREDSPVGFTIGADVTYLFFETDQWKFGGGFFLRWSGATADIQVLDNTVGSDVGGLQVGFGARFHF